MDSANVRTLLEQEGFSPEAITYALKQLGEAGGVTSPIRYARKVAENFSPDRWEPCGSCLDGFVMVEEDPILLRHCSCHPRMR